MMQKLKKKLGEVKIEIFTQEDGKVVIMSSGTNLHDPTMRKHYEEIIAFSRKRKSTEDME